MNNILVVHTYGVGDWVMFSPILKALHQEYPEAHIDVVLGTPSVALVAQNYKVNIIEKIDVRKKPFNFAKLFLTSRRKKYDLLIFTAGTSSIKIDWLSLLIKAKRKIGLVDKNYKAKFLTDTYPLNLKIHQVQNNYQILHLLGLTARPHPFIPMVKKEVHKNSILIHPGSDQANPYRRWPAHKYINVIEKLIEKGKRVSVLLGPSEKTLAQEFNKIKNSQLTIYQDLNIQQLFKLLSQQELLICNDTGIGHISAALGVRVINLFGPGNPDYSAPFTENLQIIKSQEPPTCMPCVVPGGRYGCAEQTCMQTIKVSQVLEAVLYPSSLNFSD